MRPRIQQAVADIIRQVLPQLPIANEDRTLAVTLAGYADGPAIAGNVWESDGGELADSNSRCRIR